jgi:Putative prokaryotic signal transducing protein
MPDEIDELGADPVEVFVGPPVVVEMMRSVLEGSAIPCEVWRSGMQEAYPGIGGLFPYRLVVRPGDAERARALIDAAQAGALDLGDGEEPQQGPEPDD